jgi:hypothetical protein
MRAHRQAFHVGPNYLEVDLDVHNYAFLARKALWSYHDRIPTVVWDMGFVIQVCVCVCVCVSVCWRGGGRRRVPRVVLRRHAASQRSVPAWRPCPAARPTRLQPTHHLLPASCTNPINHTPQHHTTPHPIRATAPRSCLSSCWAVVASTAATSGSSSFCPTSRRRWALAAAASQPASTAAARAA